MKLIFQKILLTALICLSIYAVAQNRKVKTIESDVILADFQSIDIKGNLSVYIKQGSATKVKIEASEDIIDNIKTEIKDGVLYLSSNKMTWDFNDNVQKVSVIVNELNHIKVKGGAFVYSENQIKSDIFEIKTEDRTDLTLDIDCKELFVNITGSANVNLSGSTNILKAQVSDSGDLRAFKLKAKVCSLELNHLADVSIYVTDTIEAIVNGSANLNYKGNPVVKKMDKNGTGLVKD